MQVIAHRGNSSACYENTMTAFDRAVADGADGIEFDLRLTKDRQWVVHHDAEVNHAGQNTPILDLTLSEVATIRVGPRQEPIPRLDEFLQWANRQSVGMIFDIKDREGIPELVATIERAGLSRPAVYSSFHRGVLKELEELRPDWPRGLIIGDPRSGLARRFLLGSILRWSSRHRLTSLHIEEHWVVPSALAKMKSAGLRLAVWTVDDPIRITMLAAFGIDAVITNRPDVAVATLRSGR